MLKSQSQGITCCARMHKQSEQSCAVAILPFIHSLFGRGRRCNGRGLEQKVNIRQQITNFRSWFFTYSLPMSPTTTTRNDRIQLPFNFDVARMSSEIEVLRPHNFMYYDVMPLRAPAHEVDSSVPFPPPAEDYADGTWTEWLDTSSLKKITLPE